MQLGRLAGIPVRVHWSLWLVAALLFGSALVSDGLLGAALGAVMVLTLATSVVLHELGHALAARAFGVQTAHITLYPFGGIAAITRAPRNAVEELVIALAGPLVNAGLFAGFFGAWLLLGGRYLLYAAAINVVMGVFNLLPAFPMDGGRVFRAALSFPLGYTRASLVALWVGRAFAWMFLIGALLTWSPSLLLVGAFLHVAVSGERRRLALERWQGVGGYDRPAAAPRAPYTPKWRLKPRSVND